MLRFLFTVLIWGCFALSARAQTLTDISFDANTVVFQISGDDSPALFSMGDGKPRIVVDLPRSDMKIDGKSLKDGPQVIEGQGAVKRIRLAARDQGLRAVLDLESGTKMAGHSIKGGTLIISLEGKSVKSPKAISHS